jgi:hypothetical protein
MKHKHANKNCTHNVHNHLFNLITATAFYRYYLRSWNRTTSFSYGLVAGYRGTSTAKKKIHGILAKNRPFFKEEVRINTCFEELENILVSHTEPTGCRQRHACH